MRRRFWPSMRKRAASSSTPPIPIDDIVEKHLKLGLEFDDTHRLFGVPRAGVRPIPTFSGAMFFDEARIVIDESLDPDENPARRVVIASRWRMRAADIGACIGTCSARTRRKEPCSMGQQRLRSSAAPARPRSGWNGRRISMRRAC